MNKNGTILVILLGMLWSFSCHAQNAVIHFNYDANGNRTSRTLGIKKVEENGKATDSLNAPTFQFEATGSFGNAKLTLYPNPTHGRVTVALQGMGTCTASTKLVTSTGAIIQQCELTDGSHDFDLSNFPPGVYLLQLTAPDVTQTWKIIKE